MKRAKKISGGRPWGLNYVKKDVEIVDGDTVTIINEGMENEGNYGPQFVIGIKLANGEERVITLNPKTENNLIEAFGEDSINWVGKKVNVFIEKTKIAGERRIVAYLAAPGWDMDEYGDFVREGDQKDSKDDIPVIKVDDEEEIPFRP